MCLGDEGVTKMQQQELNKTRFIERSKKNGEKYIDKDEVY